MTGKVCGAIEKYSLLSEGDSVIAALSGGADSVTLLHILYSIKEKYNLTLYAAHLNHQLRGEEAERDENFCKILCEKYNIRLFIKRADIKALAASQRISEELCGRNARYEFFEELSSSLGAKVATAHTSSDNAETLLFNLARGASVTGAGAIPPRRGNIIRPLIELTREEIEAYCRENSLEYVTDSTNLSDKYTRNRIRHNLVPLFRELNPSFEQAALRFSRDAAEAADYLSVAAKQALADCKTDYGYDAQGLLKLHPALVNTALYTLCKENGARPERRLIELIARILSTGGAVKLSGCAAVCTQGVLRFVKDNSESEKYCLPLDGKMTIAFGDRFFQISYNDSDKEKRPELRTRRAGDSFTFAARRLTKPLRRALAEQKVPSELRDSVPVIALGSEALWCPPLGFSKKGLEYKENKIIMITEVAK